VVPGVTVLPHHMPADSTANTLRAGNAPDADALLHKPQKPRLVSACWHCTPHIVTSVPTYLTVKKCTVAAGKSGLAVSFVDPIIL